MAFAIDMNAAAHRHLLAADTLSNGHRRDVAGYLYGIAAECAIKVMMSEIGMRPLRGRGMNHDPFFAHFPELRTILRDELRGRRGTPLVRFIEDDRFLHHWSTRMRYSHGRDIKQRWIDDWATQARRAVDSMGT